MNSIRKVLTLSLLCLMASCSPKSSPLANEAPLGRACGSTHSLVGQSRNLSSLQHGVSGILTVVSDCELKIDNFRYDGGGPNVRVYGGRNGSFSSGVNLSEQLNGRSYNGETINFFLPDGTTLDQVNSFSIWCFQFRSDFGSASF